ncbi:MAG: endonuclease III [Paludibacteraceae bacterium]|nr:endonuclease III [Paludibacteraceae bacterium]
MTLSQRYEGVLAHFRSAMPHPETELHFGSTFQLLVAVMLSAQCTDRRVNLVTPALFQKYPDATSMASATPEDLLTFIHSVSYPNSKARHLADMARQLVTRFNAQVPDTLESLTSLPGVGRKTANVILAVAFGKDAMPVDTHVLRVTNRIGLVQATTPLATERQLARRIPSHLLATAHHWFLLHGRYICLARKPKCSSCALTPFCKHFSTLNP